MDENVASSDANHFILVNGPQVNMETLGGSLSDRMCCEVDNLVATVKIRVHHAVLAAMVISVVPRLELSIR